MRIPVIVLGLLVALPCLLVSAFEFGQMAEDQYPPVDPSIVRDLPAPSEPLPYAILLFENSCKLRKQFPGVRSFINTDVPYYKNLKVKMVGGAPRIRFFKSKEDWEKNTIDAASMSIEEMQELLRKMKDDPNINEPKDLHTEVPLSQQSDNDDLKGLLEKFGVEKGLKFDKTKVPTIRETDDDVPNNKQFDMDAMLKEFAEKTLKANKDESNTNNSNDKSKTEL